MQPEIEAIRATLSNDVWLIGQWGPWALMALAACLLLFMAANTVRCRPVWHIRFAKDRLADPVWSPRSDRRVSCKDRRVGCTERRTGPRERRVGWCGRLAVDAAPARGSKDAVVPRRLIRALNRPTGHIPCWWVLAPHPDRPATVARRLGRTRQRRRRDYLLDPSWGFLPQSW